jgi:hypothetical protein
MGGAPELGVRGECGVAPRPQAARMSVLIRTDELLLDGLATHRVLTSEQAAQVARVARSTANYRLNRLRRLALVARARPYAASGTEQLHWWLTAAGRRRIGAPGRPRSVTNSPLFLRHTAATAAVPLALERLGPSVGLRLDAWQREPWESWSTKRGRYRITPDGYALVHVASEDGAVPLLVEVDRNTMEPARLREKVRRYLTYAGDDAWEPRHAMCPALLILTTSERRAAQTLAASEQERDHIELRYPGELLVGVCGQVDDIDQAVTEAVWRTDREHSDGVAPRTLTDVLAYRVSTERDGRHKLRKPWEDREREGSWW